jgi:hypothetical protein
LALQRIGDGVGAVVQAKLGQDGLYVVVLKPATRIGRIGVLTDILPSLF